MTQHGTRDTGRPDAFTNEEVERARRYHRPLYWALAADLGLGLAVLVVLAFGPLADGIDRRLDGLAWRSHLLILAGIVALVAFVVRLPLSYWRGYVHERSWGFSTQSRGGWVADRLKVLAVSLVLSSVVAVGFVGLARALPHGWPVVTAAAGALFTLVLSFLAPVVLEPVFNRFSPLPDQELSADIRELAERAGVPIRDVLLADASRRTRKENAYVSGLGRTRRVVVYDTLLQRAGPRQVRLVAAHELGHRRLRHVAAGTALGMAGAAGGVAVLWALLRSGSVLRAAGLTGPGDPRVVALLLLAATVMQLTTLPFETAVSRRWERAADRFSLRLTGDLEAFAEAHRDLARSNLADLDPPRALYLLLFTHPTPPERIALARGWARAKASDQGPDQGGRLGELIHAPLSAEEEVAVRQQGQVGAEVPVEDKAE